MEAMSTSTTCDRIDAALARIEAALSARPPGSDLQRRHEALRQAAASSLLIIDSLIAAHENAQGGGE
jgi:hypothetical protein